MRFDTLLDNIVVNIDNWKLMAVKIKNEIKNKQIWWSS